AISDESSDSEPSYIQLDNDTMNNDLGFLQRQPDISSSTTIMGSSQQQLNNGSSFITRNKDNSALADITNIAPHEYLRNAARRDLQLYTEAMMNQMLKKRKMVDYHIGDLMHINVPKIDRYSTDRPTLPCKIINIVDNKYQVACKFGIINVCYTSGKLEPLGTIAYLDLDEIPSNKLSVREASRLQNAGLLSNTIGVNASEQEEVVQANVIVENHVQIRTSLANELFYKYRN
ncbi:9690_t:CDS:2, partial [Scutellospora calospora]